MFDIEEFINNFFKHPAPSHYSDWLKVYNAMSIHTKKIKPVELLLCRRPNESDEVHQYRLSQYRPITYGSMNRATDELYRIVSGINFKLNATDETVQLINETQFGGFTFSLFLQQIVLRRMIEDPNGLLVWLPSSGYSGQSFDKVTPAPLLVYSQCIHYISDDVISFLSEEKSLVMVGKNESYEGKVFYILTKQEYYKLVQYGKKSDEKYQLELIYEHAIGEIPYSILGGDMNNYGYYDSFFAPYLAFGDEAIATFSDWQAIMVTSSHPIREEFGIECEVVEVKDKSSNPIPEGTEEYAKKKYELRPMSKSPYNTIMRKPNDPNNTDIFKQPTLDANIPSVRFIHPDINVAKYVGESWQVLVEMAEDSLHLNLGRGLISGEAKKEDKKAQASMILKIGNNFFDNIYLNSVIYIDAYHGFNPSQRGVITIDKPKTYDVKTEQDVVEEISMLKEKKAPSFFLANATLDLATKRFSGDKLMQKIFDIISLRDPLFIYSVEEKNQMVMAGYVTVEQCIDSTFIFTLLMNMANEMSPDKFVHTNNIKLIEGFDKLIKYYYPAALTPSIKPNGDEE